MSKLDVYAASFLDPFDGKIGQPKLYDGSETRSSGLKFRKTGNFTLDATGGDNYICMFPGLSNGLCFKKASDQYWTSVSPYSNHLETLTNRGNVRRSRLVSQGLKLSLLNSSDDNEGYWEAIRIPKERMLIVEQNENFGDDYMLAPSDIPTNYANYQTFQTGRLRDLHRFLFKLNSTAPDHPFKDILATYIGSDNPETFMDSHYDMIYIRLVGRIDAVTPTMIQYDFVSNHEVVYKDDTIMARLATTNTMVPNMDILLDRTRFILPAIQIA